MKKSLLLLAFLICLGSTSFAQVFVQNTLYPYNRFIYNPAAAGISGETRLTVMGRLQWLGLEGAPRLLTANIDAPIRLFDSGVGVSIIRDELGPLSTTGLNLAYAYRLELGGGRLSLGVSAGILQKAIDGNFVYNLDNGEDPLVPAGQFSSSQVVPGLAAGVMYTYPDGSGQERFYVGLSGQDLLEPSIDDLTLNPGRGTESRVARSFYLLGGYNVDITNDIRLQPSIAARTDLVSYQLDVSAHASLKTFLVGVSYRAFSNESISGIVGAKISDQLFFAYSYDFVTSELNAQNDLSSHELVISYLIQGSGRIRPGLDDVIKKVR